MLMVKVSFLLAGMLIAWAAVSDVAFAKGGGQGKQCRPGVSFDDCYKRCVSRTGPDYKSMNKCEKRCSKRGCV